MNEQEQKQILSDSMLEHWGERCDEFEQDCFACQAWEHFDKTGEIME
jgi:hypothetical protein